MASVANYVRYDASASVSNADASLVVSAGTKRKCVVAIPQEDAATISDVLFNGTSFVANARVSITNSVATTLKNVIYDYDIPDNVAANTYTVRVTTSVANANTSFDCWQLEGVSTGAPEDTGSAEAAAGVTNCTTTVDSTDGAVVLASYTNASATPTVTWSGGTVTKRGEGNETNFTSSGADGVVSGAGSKTVTATQSSTSGRSVIVAASYAAVSGPTITVQPANDVGIISNGQSTTYTVTATGTTISALTWKEDGASIADGGIYDISTTGIGTGSVTSTLTITRTDKTGTPFDIKATVTDANGNTDTNTVTDTWWTGPQLTTFPATNGSGVSTATLTCDYVTGVGEAIEVAIVLPDGRVAVTTTTTA